MIEIDLAVRVSALIEKRVQGVIVPPEIILAVLPMALQTVGRTIANGDNFALQQKDFTIAMVSGVASLSGVSDMIIDTIVTVKHPVTGYLYLIPDGTEQDLASASDTMNPPYIIDGNAIKASLGRGTGYPVSGNYPANGNIIARSNAIPTLATIHSQFEDDLVGIVADLAMPKALQAA